MKKKIFILFLLLSAITYPQNGINYKALIKDINGNVLSNATIQIQFTIVQDVTNIFIETHSSSTDANGIVIVNIGEGTATFGNFNNINWEEENHSLNVQVDTGSGYVDMGTTQFMIVPYALHAKTSENVINQPQMPTGAIFAFPASTPPTGYLSCNGQAVSRTTYANLFTLLGTSYGAGDGSTTFNLPNYNGQFLRGWDNGQGVDLDAASRIDRGDGTSGDVVGTKQTNQTLAHNHIVNPPDTNTNSAGAHIHSVDPPETTSTTNGNHDHTTNTQLGHDTSAGPDNWVQHADPHGGNWGQHIGSTSTSGNHSHTLNISAFASASSGNHNHNIDISQFNSGNNGGVETRPTNVYVLWCIKF